MKVPVVYIFVVFVVAITSSQPTYNFEEDSDCDCASREDLELLQNQVSLLKETVDRILNTKTTPVSADVTTSSSVSPSASTSSDLGNVT